MASSQYNPKRVFTVEEANKTLPLVQRIVADIQRCYRDLADRQLAFAQAADSESGADRAYGDETLAMRDELERQKEQLVDYVRELDDLGVELKQPSAGLIDFPSMKDGRIVYLCWKLGEPRVEYWHELDAGFRGRQPLRDSPVDSTAGP